MADEARIDRLAEALEAALADPRAPVAAGEPEIAELLVIVNDLRACRGRSSRRGSGRTSRGGSR